MLTAPVATSPRAVPATVGSINTGNALFVPVEMGITGMFIHPFVTALFVPSPPNTATHGTSLSFISRAAIVESSSVKVIESLTYSTLISRIVSVALRTICMGS